MANNEKRDKEELIDAFPEIDFDSPDREIILEIVDELIKLEEEKRKKKEEEKKK